jgi:Protein of unknown function (DUF998)
MKPADTSTAPSHGSRQIFLHLSALAGVVGPILFAVVFTLDGLVHPDYSAMRETISALSEERVNGWIQIANFFVFGLLLLAFALGFSSFMQPVLKRGWVKVGLMLLIIVGVGFINEGVFATGEPGTLSSLLHTIGFLILLLSLLLTFLIIGLQCVRIPEWHGYGWYTLITFLASIGTFVFWIYTTTHVPQIAGLVERLLFIVLFAWYVVTGGRFLTHFRARKAGEISA